MDVEAFLRSIREHPMSEEALDAIEEHIQQRHQPSRRER
jgi:hypothetical protein